MKNFPTTAAIGLLSVLLMLEGGLTAYGQGLMNSPIAEVDKQFPGLDLLPPGSVLESVSLPRYEKYRVSLLVTSPRMKVESRTELSGREVHTYMYDRDGQETGRLYMTVASYFFDTHILRSSQRITLKDKRLDAVGTGITFDTVTETGLIHGPVKTVLRVSELKRKDQSR